jgi:hypothetical protein
MKEALSSSENVGFYKSHTVYHPRRRHSSLYEAVVWIQRALDRFYNEMFTS